MVFQGLFSLLHQTLFSPAKKENHLQKCNLISCFQVTATLAVGGAAAVQGQVALHEQADEKENLRRKACEASAN